MSNQNKLVTIGLATYNGSRYLGEALDSLLSQTHANFELVISDNASTDDTQKICQEYAKKDRRIRYIRQKKNIEGFENLKFVLGQAKGNYFVWAADDDLWEPTFISELLSLLSSVPSAVLAMPRIVNIDTKGAPYSMRTEFIDTRGMSYFKRTSNVLYQCPPDYFCGLFRTKALSEILKDELFSIPDLGDYTLLLLKSHGVIWIGSDKGDIITHPKILFYKRNHPWASQSRVKSQKISSLYVYFTETCKKYDFQRMNLWQRFLIIILVSRICLQFWTVHYAKNSFLRKSLRGILLLGDRIWPKLLKI